MVATQTFLGEDEPILTSIFFRWVETTNQIDYGVLILKIIFGFQASWCFVGCLKKLFDM